MVDPPPHFDDEAPTRDLVLISLPETLGPCRLVRRLGSGGMATVYLAEMTEARPYAAKGAPVAVKILDREQFGGADAIQRFEREAAMGRAVAHSALVRTHEMQSAQSERGALHFIILEYIEGRSLSQMIKELRILSEGFLRDVAADTARALAALHAAGILHRDLKPSNVLITPDHQVKLTDLGIARLIEEDQRLTRAGLFVGTPLYASPEQLLGQHLGPASDLYSLGVVLYEAATGDQPFASGGVQAVMRRHLELVPSKAGQRNPQLSPFFEELIACLLEKDPARRFSSAVELALALEEGEDSAWWRGREAAVRASQPRRDLRRAWVARESRLVGREAELQALSTYYEEARAGQGRVVLIEGEAGVGKSRFVDEFVRRLEERQDEPRVLYGSYPPGNVPHGAGALAEAVVAHLGEVELEAKLSRALAATPRLVPAFAAFLMGGPPPEGAEPLTSEGLHTVFGQLARAFTAERPLVWIVEDLHFGSGDARSLLLSLARAAQDQAALLIATSRQPFSSEDVGYLDRLGVGRRVVLARLSAREVIYLMRDALRSEALAEQLGGRIAAKSDGNPFFILEMLRELKERAALTLLPDGSYAAKDPIERITVPSSVRDLLLDHLKDLPREDRALIDLGAVQGFTFDPDLIARVREMRRLHVLEALAGIERRHGVVRATGAGFRFDHHQLQEVLYAALPPPLRAEYHALLAEAEETRSGLAGRAPEEVGGEDAVFLCEHYLKGGRTEAGTRLVLRALDHMEALYQSEQLLDLARIALEALGDQQPELRCEIHLRQIECLDLLGRREAQRTAVNEAMALASQLGNARLVARARLAAGYILYATSDYVGARVPLEEAIAQFEATGDRQMAARAMALLGGIFRNMGQPERARLSFEQRLGLALQTGDRREQAEANLDVGVSHTLAGEYEKARTLLERSLSLAREIGSRRLETNILGTLAITLWSLGRGGEGRTAGEAHLELCQRLGFRQGELFALANLGLAFVEEGRLFLAQSRLSSALDLARALGQKHFESGVLTYFGHLARARGEGRLAQARYEEALQVCRPLQTLLAVAEGSFSLGRLLLERGDTEAARPLIEEAHRLTEELSAREPGPLPAAYLALLGVLDPGGIEVSERSPVYVRAEAHLVLHRVTGSPHHLARARALLDRMCEHLEGADLEAFWIRNLTARSLRQLELS
jgi:predicted ATPase